MINKDIEINIYITLTGARRASTSLLKLGKLPGPEVMPLAVLRLNLDGHLSSIAKNSEVNSSNISAVTLLST